MNDQQTFGAMLEMMTDALPSALAYVDRQGEVSFFQISRRPVRCWHYYQGKNVAKLLRALFGPAAKKLLGAFQTCSDSQTPVEIRRFQHQTVRNMTEYLDWRFKPAPARGDVMIYVCNVTDNVGIEEEFAAISQQNEVTTRELHAAMSELDFRLMDLDQAHKKFAALYRITSIVQHTVRELEVLEEIVDGITTLMGFMSAAILLLDEERQELVVAADRGYQAKMLRLPWGKGITWRAVLNRDIVFIPDVTKEPAYVSGGTSGVSEIAIPLIFADKIIGVLDIESSADRPVQPYDLNLLQSLASQVALTILHAQYVARVEADATTDALTGLYNYRFFLGLLDQEFKRAVRYNRPLALIMIDIDFFKEYNDTHGHPLGNDILRKVAQIAKANCRDVDFVVRYGGEEFVVLLPETSMPEAFDIAEQIRIAISKFPFAGRKTQPGGVLTVSIGVAAYPQDAYSDKEILEHADTALYLAKRSTRNRVVCYSKSAPTGA